MSEGVKKILLYILKFLLIFIGALIVLKAAKYIIPFILAYVFASLIEPIVKFLEKKIRIPRKIGTILSILVVLGAVVSLLIFIISRLVLEIKNFYLSLELNVDKLTDFFNDIAERFNGIYIQLPDKLTEIINTQTDQLTSNLQNLLKPFYNFAQNTVYSVMSLPQVFIFILVTLVATYFMSSDKMAILRFLERQIPSTWMKNSRGIAQNIFVALFGWIKAQFILLLITFSEMLVGMLIIGVENALLIAVIIALVDLLPVLGTGSVLIPWAIFSLVGGNTKMGLSLVLLYVICLFVRQLVEPRIVGQQIGVHPLFTLFGMYVGLQLFGVLGMFLGPLSIVILKYLIEGIMKADSFKNIIEKNFKLKSKSSPSQEQTDSGDTPRN